MTDLHSPATTDYFPFFARHIDDLKPKKDSLEGSCPSCRQRSFSAKRWSGTWRCFTCGKGGDPQKFETMLAGLKDPAQAEIQEDAELIQTY